MSSKKEELENIKISQVIALLNNIMKHDENTSINNDLLSVMLEQYNAALSQGKIPTRAEFSHLLNRAMDYTRADPNIIENDELLQTGQDILTLELLPCSPKRRAKTRLTSTKVFQIALLGSQRRAFHHMDARAERWQQEIMTNYNVIENTTVFPSGSPPQLTNNKKKKRFKVVK